MERGGRGKLLIARVTDEKTKMRVGLMWGGKDMKEYTIQRAQVTIRAGEDGEQPHEWKEAVKLIQNKMEQGLNQAFAMSRFRGREQWTPG